MDRKFIKYLSLFLIWLFTISGITGILNPDYTDWFLNLTPVNLMLTFIILLANIETFKWQIFIAFLIPFLLGFTAEALGVNYGLIFGNYAYGENLGYKVIGVPVMICINWIILTVTSADIAQSISKNSYISSIIGALLMTILDVIIEVSAPRFDFWEFEGGTVPLQNYLGWFFTALVAHLLYQSFKIKTRKVISCHIFISIVVFFTAFIFF